MTALSLMGSAALLYSCEDDAAAETPNTETLMTEQSENLSIVMSENGRKSYIFKTPLLEGYTLARDPYREFRKGVDITTFQDDSLSSVNATLTSNYAIYYENRKLWEAKGDVVVIKADGTELYTQQLFWNSMTHRIYSNVDTKIVKGSDVFFGEGFESDEDLKQWRFRRMSGRMLVNIAPNEDEEAGDENAADVAAKSPDSGSRPASAAPAPKPAEPQLEPDNSRRPGMTERRNKGIERREMVSPDERIK